MTLSEFLGGNKRRLLFHRNLLDTALMAAAFKVRFKERVDNGKSQFRSDETGRKHKHIGIVVLTGKLGKLHVPAKSRTDALMLVEGHVDSVAASADADSGELTARLNGLGAGMREVGIVAAFRRRSAIVLKLNAFGHKIAFYDIFQLIACMIRTDGKFFAWYKY